MKPPPPTMMVPVEVKRDPLTWEFDDTGGWAVVCGGRTYTPQEVVDYINATESGLIEFAAEVRKAYETKNHGDPLKRIANALDRLGLAREG